VFRFTSWKYLYTTIILLIHILAIWGKAHSSRLKAIRFLGLKHQSQIIIELFPSLINIYYFKIIFTKNLTIFSYIFNQSSLCEHYYCYYLCILHPSWDTAIVGVFFFLFSDSCTTISFYYYDFPWHAYFIKLKYMELMLKWLSINLLVLYKHICAQCIQKKKYLLNRWGV